MAKNLPFQDILSLSLVCKHTKISLDNIQVLLIPVDIYYENDDNQKEFEDIDMYEQTMFINGKIFWKLSRWFFCSLYYLPYRRSNKYKIEGEYASIIYNIFRYDRKERGDIIVKRHHKIKIIVL